MQGYFIVFLKLHPFCGGVRHQAGDIIMRLLAAYIEKLKILTCGSPVFKNAKAFCIQASVLWKF